MRLTLIFILFTTFLFAQKNRTDVGGGTSEQVKIPITILDKIEKNQEIDIEKYFLNKNDYKEKKWKKYIKKIQSEFANNDNSLPASDVKSSENIWYERTYFEELENDIKYYFQVYFDLVEIDNEIKIKRVIFKKGKRIINRDKEIERLGDISIPPPPPAIPDF